MKTIIFDVDNTLVDWPDDYTMSVKLALDNLNISYDSDLPLKIYNIVDDYEQEHTFYKKEELIKFINKNLNVNLPLEFIDEYIKTIGNQVATNDENLEECLKYLSTKYDLFVISNWFTESQRMRLEKMGILKYFKKIYGGDINYLKPNPKTFDIILKDYSKEDCIYVGDKLKTDIEFAESLGIKPIWKTEEESNKYITIKKISDLKYIL